MDFKEYKGMLAEPRTLLVGLLWGLVVVYVEGWLEKILLFLNLIGDYFFEAIFFLATLPGQVPKWVDLQGSLSIVLTVVFAILLVPLMVWLWRLSKKVVSL